MLLTNTKVQQVCETWRFKWDDFDSYYSDDTRTIASVAPNELLHYSASLEEHLYVDFDPGSLHKNIKGILGHFI